MWKSIAICALLMLLNGMPAAVAADGPAASSIDLSGLPPGFELPAEVEAQIEHIAQLQQPFEMSITHFLCQRMVVIYPPPANAWIGVLYAHASTAPPTPGDPVDFAYTYASCPASGAEAECASTLGTSCTTFDVFVPHDASFGVCIVVHSDDAGGHCGLKWIPADLPDVSLPSLDKLTGALPSDIL